MTNSLSDIQTWKHYFGLLPIHLKPTQSESSYVMLNGGYGDFCLQTLKDESNTEQYFSRSWSSNTKNFIVLNNENIEIYNWNKNKPEVVKEKQVKDNLDKFYKYLLSNSYKSNKDIVPFIIDIFREFRNITQERSNPVEALNLLFLLLANITDDVSKSDYAKWNLKNINIPNGFDYYIELIRNGISNIKPEQDLVLRHSAGVLFQEAQKEVLFFNPQLDLFGGISNRLDTKNSLYSSIHYTPPYLARTIVENAIKNIDLTKPRLKIFDPACGSAEFLIESLKQLKEINYPGIVELIGWDSSETAINTSSFLLSYEKRTIWQDRLIFNVSLVNDSLRENWNTDYDLILMNPPFVSWEQMDKESREAVNQVLSTNIVGRPNQASAFFYKSIQSLGNDGVFGCVVPSSLLTLDAYQKLRNESYGLLTFNLIGKLGNFVFEDALTDVSLIIGSKPKKDSIPTVLWTKNEKGIAQEALRDLRKMSYNNLFKIDEKDYSIYKPNNFPITKESWKPISIKENELFKTIERFVLEKKLVRIESIFNVQQGIRTGNNSVFKISEIEYNEIPQKEKKYFRPAIDNESIKNGLLFKNSYVWYPYDEEGILIHDETQLTKLVPFFYKNKLKQFRNDLIGRARKDDSDWWSLSEHRAWLREKKPRLVSTEFGKSDSFAFDQDGSFAVERGNGWLPKKEFKNKDFYYFYLAILSSNFFDKLLSIYSKQLLAGWDLGKKYTSEIPIPDLFVSEVSGSIAYNKLVEIGKELSKGNLYVKSSADEILVKYFYPEL